MVVNNLTLVGGMGVAESRNIWTDFLLIPPSVGM